MVVTLHTDRWIAALNEGLEIENPSWSDIADAIKALDGNTRTMINLGIGGQAHMTIGGGTAGEYVVYATFDNACFHNLLNPTKLSSKEKVSLVAGGQLGEYPERLCVPLELVLEAAKAFSDSGVLASGATWEVDKGIS